MTSTAIYNQNFISILNIKISHYLIHNTRKRRKLYFITKEDFWVDIQEAIDILKISESFSIPQKIWHIQNNNSNSPKCIGCDKSAKWQPGINMYGEFCCLVCSSKSKIKQLRMQDTCLEKYGVRNVFQLESVKQKSIETTQHIYGVDNISKLDSIKTKKEQTMFSNYNRYNNFGIDGEEFMMNKYGVRNAAQISSNSHLQHNRFKSRYNITLPSNITITVQGYERYAIPYIF